MEPAASGLLSGAYSRAALTDRAHLPGLHVAFDYLDAKELLTIGVSLGLATLLLRGYLRIAEPWPVRMLRAIHNGSVNDYAAYAAAGTVILTAPDITALAEIIRDRCRRGSGQRKSHRRDDSPLAAAASAV